MDDMENKFSFFSNKHDDTMEVVFSQIHATAQTKQKTVWVDCLEGTCSTCKLNIFPW